MPRQHPQGQTGAQRGAAGRRACDRGCGR
jgi:hypothetical protein